MTLFVRRIGPLAIGSLLAAGCGGGDQAPHPVDQPASTTGAPASPGQVDNLNRSSQEAPTSLQPPELFDQQGTGRRGFWVAPPARPAFTEWTMRETALDALARIGESAVPALVGLLDDPDRQVRIDALVALARIGPEAAAAVPNLTTLVESDPDETVRKNAVRALGQIGPAAAKAVPELVEQVRAGVDSSSNERPSRSGPRGNNSSGSAQPGDAR
ncbi:MAG TPA: HEAT repeat domain-containing protein [Pirellulales bacterium]|jgi:hypothetical protein|nr:HEAT repeat domain-containing protein [Pirellulales bacterium]